MYMSVEELTSAVRDWAASEPMIRRAYIFGSRARGDDHDDSDLDVAVELNKAAGDENVLATWIFEQDGLQEHLANRLDCKVDLQLLDGEDTPVVRGGVDDAGVLIYEHDSA